jgi:hypothetical protein
MRITTFHPLVTLIILEQFGIQCEQNDIKEMQNLTELRENMKTMMAEMRTLALSIQTIQQGVAAVSNVTNKLQLETQSVKNNTKENYNRVVHVFYKTIQTLQEMKEETKSNLSQVLGAIQNSDSLLQRLKEEMKAQFEDTKSLMQGSKLGTRGYIGCFVDKADRDLTESLSISRTNTIEYCRQFCEGFTYFGTEDRKECFCGNSYGKHGQVNESECNMKCNGNQSQTCGGLWRLSVYRTDGQVQPSTRGYIGCYVDSTDRDLSAKMAITKTITIEYCRRFCEGFTYFGTEHREECFCGNSYGKHGKVDETQCHMQCRGNQTQICGGPWRLSIYRTDGQDQSKMK